MASARGKNYVQAELNQLVYSVLKISNDPLVGSGQKSEKFWSRVKEHYDAKKLSSFEERGSKSLESKWAEIKHDVGKFVGVYQQVEGLQISETNNEDTLLKARELYKQNNPKGKPFSYESCFWILKDVPRWMKPEDEMATKRGAKSQKAKGKQGNSSTSPGTTAGEGDLSDTIQEQLSDGGCENQQGTERKRPGGNRKAKDDLKRMKYEQDALRASMKHQANLDVTNAERIQCMQVNTMMRLIMMPTSNLNPEMRAFAERFQLQEAQKLQRRMDKNVSDVAAQGNMSPVPTEPEESLERSPSRENAAAYGEYYVPAPHYEANLFEDQRQENEQNYEDNRYQSPDHVQL